MDKPLTVWYCDKCGNRIENMNDGYVIWNRDSSSAYCGFAIIHQNKCDNKSFPLSAALRDFLGVSGLVLLTSLLSAGPIIGGKPHNQVTDMDEFIDFFRRLQLPYYEEARQLFDRSDLRDDYYDHSEVSPYQPEILAKMIEQYGSSD